MSVTMEEAVSAVREMLEDREVRYSLDNIREMFYVFSLGFNLSHTKLSSANVKISVIPSKKNPEYCHRIVSYATIGIKADEDSIHEVAEFLHRANYGLAFGNFELDFDDGEIRYKMSLNCVDSLPGEDAIEDVLYLPLSMFERYGDGILTVAMGLAEPEAAIKKIEE
ncbi:MAG: YbjN domain-containing protein [Selenomonadaceae bacterium]|nr:YbjN domain-containing protein [Selenomonadaceae bacterium]